MMLGMEGISLWKYGTKGWLCRWEDEKQFEEILPAATHVLEQDAPADLLEYVVGFQTVLLLFRKPVPERFVESWLEDCVASRAAGRGDGVGGFGGRLHRIPVCYDGEDLEEFSQGCGMEKVEVVRLHSGPVYTVRMMGFAPGFPYLHPLDERLRMQRRDVPRARIEPGSVAVGGSHTGIYSIASPGGWHILGRTDPCLFMPDAARKNHPDASEVFLFHPGDRVKFEPVE